MVALLQTSQKAFVESAG